MTIKVDISLNPVSTSPILTNEFIKEKDRFHKIISAVNNEFSKLELSKRNISRNFNSANEISKQHMILDKIEDLILMMDDCFINLAILGNKTETFQQNFQA